MRLSSTVSTWGVDAPAAGVSFRAVRGHAREATALGTGYGYHLDPLGAIPPLLYTPRLKKFSMAGERRLIACAARVRWSPPSIYGCECHARFRSLQNPRRPIFQARSLYGGCVAACATSSAVTLSGHGSSGSSQRSPHVQQTPSPGTNRNPSTIRIAQLRWVVIRTAPSYGELRARGGKGKGWGECAQPRFRSPITSLARVYPTVNSWGRM